MEEISPKSRLTTTLLCILPVFVGIAGIHRFYLGKIKTAIGMLILGILGAIGFFFGVLLASGGFEYGVLWTIVGTIFLAVVGIWTLIDFIFAVAGKMKDKEGKLIKNWW